jgi:YgiT-type zinc finger domain-containing protein
MIQKFDRCEYCDGLVRARRVTVDLRRGNKLYVFYNVPIGVCTRCGERYYPGPILERLDELAAHGMNGAKRMSVPTLDLATKC